MNKLLASICSLMLCVLNVQAQIVINEVLYNVPGSGESEEFIELYNAGTTPVNMQNYTFTDGINYTFGNVTIAAGGYFIVAADTAAFAASFGSNATAEWSGGLSNGGEDITLFDGSGNLIDSIDYETSAPWPTPAAGQGRSIQLCDPNSDNNIGANWGFNNTASGLNGISGIDTLYATPGYVNECVFVAPPAPVNFPVYSMSQINSVNASGVVDSAGISCELRGVAHCIDFRGGNGYDFILANSDNSAGIRVFSFNDQNNYSFQAGDSLHIQGRVSQYYGLLQFSPDSIGFVSSSNNTASAAVVTTLDESSENRFVSLQNVYLADTAEWTGTGSGFNVNVTNGVDSFLLRIDNDVDLYNQAAPLGNFTISGWGSQYDDTAPLDEGYQLVPCSMTMLLNKQTIYPSQGVLKLYPNPSTQVLNIESDQRMQQLAVFNTIGQQVLSLDNINRQQIQLNTAALSNGIYILQIVENNQQISRSFQIAR
jgi:hypothetical protein